VVVQGLTAGVSSCPSFTFHSNGLATSCNTQMVRDVVDEMRCELTGGRLVRSEVELLAANLTVARHLACVCWCDCVSYAWCIKKRGELDL
jgi:hypothetical protein